MLARHPNVKKWVVYALNEETVLGAVRATEQLHIPAADVIGVGINGAGEAFAEFQKKEPTGFTDDRRQLDEPRQGQHAEPVDWIRGGKTPPADTQTSGKLMTRANWQAVRAEHLSARGENAMTTQTMTAVSGNDVAETPPGGLLLALDGITVTFPGVCAPDAVSLSVRAGEVHGLMGENGAGSRRC